jgi:hypothetical protein
MKASPRWPVTNPPVSTRCMDAIRKLLTPDTSKRLGAAGFRTFTEHPFFTEIDFEALERKEIPPVFVPSSEKTNFDATYDLEELLLEEAPLEARARRQKPRERLKDDATAQEIREEELHKMIETLFEPFDYTTVAYDKLISECKLLNSLLTRIQLCWNYRSCHDIRSTTARFCQITIKSPTTWDARPRKCNFDQCYPKVWKVHQFPSVWVPTDRIRPRSTSRRWQDTTTCTHQQRWISNSACCKRRCRDEK